MRMPGEGWPQECFFCWRFDKRCLRKDWIDWTALLERKYIETEESDRQDTQQLIHHFILRYRININSTTVIIQYLTFSYLLCFFWRFQFFFLHSFHLSILYDAWWWDAWWLKTTITIHNILMCSHTRLRLSVELNRELLGCLVLSGFGFGFGFE